jgi:hypothetical protein
MQQSIMYKKYHVASAWHTAPGVMLKQEGVYAKMLIDFCDQTSKWTLN